jgi:hypothetical protein
VIHLHCGWPKTGTTSLQAAIAKHRGQLASAGVIYPDKWGRNGDDTHNEIADLLNGGQGQDAASEEIKAVFAGFPGEDMLLSGESLTTLLLADKTCEVLLQFLHGVRELAPVTCIWTLRRFDDMIHSLYVQAAAAAMVASQPAVEFMEGLDWQDRIFANMRRVEEAVDGRAIYVRYDPAGRHNAELLNVFGLRGDLADSIGSELGESTRLNTSRSHKQLVTAVNVDWLSAGSGVALSRRALLEAFDRGELSFEDDQACELVGREVRRDLHERAVEAARECGFTPYLRFFEAEELGEFPSPMRLDPDVLNDEDLSRLRSHARSL